MSLEEGAFGGLWPWEQITPHDVAEVLQDLPVPWWIAGGLAIELFLGRSTRRHHDLDFAVLRRDQLALMRHLVGWDIYTAKATPERRLERWDGQLIELPVARFWARPRPGAAWWLDGRLEEARDDRWLYRGHERVSLPLSHIGRTTDDGIPFLAPEITLFYMLLDATPKAKADFLAVRPHLRSVSREWLRRAVELVAPDHPVLPLL